MIKIVCGRMMLVLVIIILELDNCFVGIIKKYGVEIRIKLPSV
jgi:hypothetical protein